MCSQCKPSCTPTHAIETSCTTPIDSRRYHHGIPFQRRIVQERSGITKDKATRRYDVLVDQLNNICVCWQCSTTPYGDSPKISPYGSLGKTLPFQSYQPISSHVQTLRKNDTEQNCTDHQTTPNYEIDRFHTW